jgi:glycerophosphoryl diester phosphodiesterase
MKKIFNKKYLYGNKKLFLYWFSAGFIQLCFACGLTLSAQTGISTSAYQSANPKTNSAITYEDMIKLDYGYFSKLKKDLSGGILGAGQHSSANTKLSVYLYDKNKADGKGARLYHVYARPAELEAGGNIYYAHTEDIVKYLSPADAGLTASSSIRIVTKSDDIQKLAQNEKINNLDYCENLSWYHDLWTTVKATFWSLLPGSSYNAVACIHFTPVQSVIVEIETDNPAAVASCKVPGIVGGELRIENGKVVVDRRNVLGKYCSVNPNSAICGVYNRLRFPGQYNPGVEDIYVAQHRGHWGDNLGKGYPENTKEAVSDAFTYFPQAKIAEMDITITKENNLIMMHDYVMKRLTNYTGDEFSFDLTLDEVKPLYARRRNESVSSLKISRFSDVLDEAISHDAILMLDVKEMQIKKDNNGNCVANCKYESIEAQRNSWKKIINLAIDQTHDKAKNIIIKTYYDPDEVIRLTGERINHVMWTPMILEKLFQNKANPLSKEQLQDTICNFIDNWENKAGENVAYYETDFMRSDDCMLQPFVRDNMQYDNMLHYIYATTGRRSGVFSEEPAGPRGCVNRWGDWDIKNTQRDLRTDPYVLLTLPYGNIMVVTTDRADVWKQIKESFNTAVSGR